MSAVPRVSVVLPFRDAAATFDDALASLTTQTLPDVEYLLVDNGSLDSSAAIARRRATRDVRFRILRTDGGLVGALNAGCTAARAPLIARMDADDIAHPMRLERQMAALAADPDLSVSSCLVEVIGDGSGAGMRRYVAWLNGIRTPAEIRAALFVESPIAHPTAMLRRDALTASGGYRDGDFPEDYDLWLRLLLRGHQAAKVPEVLLSWRDAPGRLSRVDRRYRRSSFLATKLEHFPQAVPHSTPLQICGAGPTGRAWARALGARGYRVRRFIDVDPRRWGRTIDGAPVEPPAPPNRADGLLLAAVGGDRPRQQLAAWLTACGLRPWIDYLAVA